MRKNYFMMSLIFWTVFITYGFGQKSKELSFKEKWKIEVPDKIQVINFIKIPGNLKIIAVAKRQLDFKVFGKEVYKLHSGNIGKLGIQLVKSRESYQIIGVPDQIYDIEYVIEVPDDCHLLVQSAFPFDTTKLEVANHKGPITITKNAGPIILDGVHGPVIADNRGGPIHISYDNYSQETLHSIAATGEIKVNFKKEIQADLELVLLSESGVFSNRILKNIPHSLDSHEGSFSPLPEGTYTSKINRGGALLQIYAASKGVYLHFQ